MTRDHWLVAVAAVAFATVLALILSTA